MLQGGNHAVRRSALERIGGYNTAIAFHGEDTVTAFRLMRVGVVKFSFRLPIFTSGRRLRKEGVLRTAWTYALNSIFVILYGRPRARAYTDVRDPPARNREADCADEDSQPLAPMHKG